MSFKRLQGRLVPMMAPFQHAGLVNFVLVREIFTHARHDQRMRIACDDLCKATDSRARLRVFRQERWICMCFVKIFKDSKGFEKYRAVILDQCWNCNDTVASEIYTLPLVAAHPI